MGIDVRITSTTVAMFSVHRTRYVWIWLTHMTANVHLDLVAMIVPLNWTRARTIRVKTRVFVLWILRIPAVLFVLVLVDILGRLVKLPQVNAVAPTETTAVTMAFALKISVIAFLGTLGRSVTWTSTNVCQCLARTMPSALIKLTIMNVYARLVIQVRNDIFLLLVFS